MVHAAIVLGKLREHIERLETLIVDWSPASPTTSVEEGAGWKVKRRRGADSRGVRREGRGRAQALA